MSDNTRDIFSVLREKNNIIQKFTLFISCLISHHDTGINFSHKQDSFLGLGLYAYKRFSTFLGLGAFIVLGTMRDHA